MTRTVFRALAAALLLSAPAQAAPDAEVSLELGTLHNGSQSWDLFSERDGMPSRGLRGGVGVGDKIGVTVLGGWHRVRRGSEVGLGEGGQLVAAYFADEFTVGPKVHYAIGQVLYPYVSTQGLLLRGTMKLDDDTTTGANPGQVQASALSGGALFLGGLEVRIPQNDFPMTAALYTEWGYGLVSRAEYGDFGPMQPGGLAMRTGVGVRF